MARKSIYEFDAKHLLAKELPKYFPEFDFHGKLAIITPETNLDELAKEHSWLKEDKLVCKPDQLFGKRGKSNLLLLDADFKGLKAFVKEKINKEMDIRGKVGKITRLLVEPYIPHETEYYASITELIPQGFMSVTG